MGSIAGRTPFWRQRIRITSVKLSPLLRRCVRKRWVAGLDPPDETRSRIEGVPDARGSVKCRHGHPSRLSDRQDRQGCRSRYQDQGRHINHRLRRGGATILRRLFGTRPRIVVFWPGISTYNACDPADSAGFTIKEKSDGKRGTPICRRRRMDAPDGD